MIMKTNNSGEKKSEGQFAISLTDARFGHMIKNVALSREKKGMTARGKTEFNLGRKLDRVPPND